MEWTTGKKSRIDFVRGHFVVVTMPARSGNFSSTSKNLGLDVHSRDQELSGGNKARE